MKQQQQAPMFDRKEQLAYVEGGLLQGEQILAVLDCKGTMTGFIGLTSRRIVILHNSFLGKHVALVSLPYSRVASVSLVTDRSFRGGWFGRGHLIVSTTGGDHYEVEFRGGPQKTKFAHDLILWGIGQSH